MLKVVKLEVLGRNGAQTVPVQPQHQQGVGQILEAVRLQHGDAVVIHVPEQNVNTKITIENRLLLLLIGSNKVFFLFLLMHTLYTGKTPR